MMLEWQSIKIWRRQKRKKNPGTSVGFGVVHGTFFVCGWVLMVGPGIVTKTTAVVKVWLCLDASLKLWQQQEQGKMVGRIFFKHSL